MGLQQFDVENAFFLKHLEEKVFMKSLPGFNEAATDRDTGWKNGLYGLKQSPKACFDRTKAKRKMGY